MRKILIFILIMFSFLGKSQTKIGGIIFPKDEFAVVNSSYDGKPAVIVVNTGLRKFKAKDIFGWSCSLVLEYKDLAENGMPTSDESNFVYQYFEQLNDAIKGDPSHPNAVFLARITHNGTLEAIWQVNNPDVVHKYLQQIIEEKSYPREMDYRIEYDAKWTNVDWYLQDFSKKK